MKQYTFLDFFAGSGLVTEGMESCFECVWAIDHCPKKAAVYSANHPGGRLTIGPIEMIRGKELPAADLAWASFPCQDLSLAGRQLGMNNGTRSGLVWHWLRVLDQMLEGPPILVVENVVGLISSQDGDHFRALHHSLRERGYKSGAVILDAVDWLPQSRPRVFVIAVPVRASTQDCEGPGPTWAHQPAVQRVARGLDGWVWWHLPKPGPRTQDLHDILEVDAPYHDEKTSAHNLSLIAPAHRVRLAQELQNGLKVAPGYKRTRNGGQVLELRFDGVAGCLRTPKGGSSRQLLVVDNGGRLMTRLLSVRETARLMGAPET